MTLTFLRRMGDPSLEIGRVYGDPSLEIGRVHGGSYPLLAGTPKQACLDVPGRPA